MANERLVDVLDACDMDGMCKQTLLLCDQIWQGWLVSCLW